MQPLNGKVLGKEGSWWIPRAGTGGTLVVHGSMNFVDGGNFLYCKGVEYKVTGEFILGKTKMQPWKGLPHYAIYTSTNPTYNKIGVRI